MYSTPLHSFHIPVMGLAFTIDSPVKVARYGISSVVSIIEDRLIETMRKYYYEQQGWKFKPIPTKDPDHRARRITDYLNLLDTIVRSQVERMKTMAFEAGSELTKYFEMLPAESKLAEMYRRMLKTQNSNERDSLEVFLRSQVKAGSIDANIMTKVDKNNYDQDGNEIAENSDALAALRGYAMSALSNSSLILSAGLNPRLFNYLEKFTDFYPTGWGEFKKRIVIKVSDFRSALIQGKILAKKGLWVSEYRIESGLNCGGHAFASDGLLMGPILQEFKDRKDELINELHSLYIAAAEKKGFPAFSRPHPLRLSVQGGIGTAEEDSFLRHHYGIDATGWGTPFLLCREATTVDDATLSLLVKADQSAITLSKNSPLGIRFHYLKGTSSDREKQHRIDTGKPGSPCTEKHLSTNTEFTTQPICTASRTYQKLKLEQLQGLSLGAEELERRTREVLDKECLCVGLSNAVHYVYNAPFLKKLNSVTICPGPNIVYFNREVSLQEMVDHIYGRTNILTEKRPHVFVNELKLYVEYLGELVEAVERDAKQDAYIDRFAKSLLAGIEYYRGISMHIQDREDFFAALEAYEKAIEGMLDCLLQEKV